MGAFDQIFRQVKRVVISRHPAAIQFLARELGGRYSQLIGAEDINAGASPFHCIEILGPADRFSVCEVTETVPIIMDRDATVEDVQGKVVYGNVPNHLACAAEAVAQIEFAKTPPRGREYTLADMDAAGAHLAWYGVLRLDPETILRDYLQQGGFAL